jgi:transcriptional regulator with XRE-family HTH domain
MTQSQLAQALGVTQAYVSQLESGERPVSRKLAARLAKLPDLSQLPATVFPEDGSGLDRHDRDHAADLAALGYPGFSASAPAPPKNPAAVIIAILKRRNVAPAIMAAIPWVLLRFPAINVDWLVAQARLHNLQNRLGFLTDLAIRIRDAAHLAPLLSALEESRLAKTDTLARDLSASERQFFEEHRSETARHWNLLTGLTRDTLPHVRE